MPFYEISMLALVGLIAGICGGLLGIGGAIVMIPGLVLLFGPDKQHLYQASTMIVSFFIVAPAVLRHRQARATLRPVTRMMVPGAMLGVVLGVYLSDMRMFRGSGQGYLQIAFSIFLGYVMIYNLVGLRSKRSAERMNETQAAGLSKFATFAFVGFPTGVLSGLLGIGGGLYAVPSQQLVLGMPLPNAIANSATTMLWSSLLGAAFKNAHLTQHGHTWKQAVIFAACLIPTAMAGSWYTAKKVHQLPLGVIRFAFVILLTYCGSKVFIAGWEQISGL